MKLEKLYTDWAFHPERRRVKVVVITRVRGAETTSGSLIRVDNEDVVGAYPVLWSRIKPGSGGYIVEGVVLAENAPILTQKFEMEKIDFDKLDETDIEW